VCVVTEGVGWCTQVRYSTWLQQLRNTVGREEFDSCAFVYHPDNLHVTVATLVAFDHGAQFFDSKAGQEAAVAAWSTALVDVLSPPTSATGTGVVPVHRVTTSRSGDTPCLTTNGDTGAHCTAQPRVGITCREAAGSVVAAIPTLSAGAAFILFADVDSVVARLRGAVRVCLERPHPALRRLPQLLDPSASGWHLPNIVHASFLRFRCRPSSMSSFQAAFARAAARWPPTRVPVTAVALGVERAPYLHFVPADATLLSRADATCFVAPSSAAVPKSVAATASGKVEEEEVDSGTVGGRPSSVAVRLPGEPYGHLSHDKPVVFRLTPLSATADLAEARSRWDLLPTLRVLRMLTPASCQEVFSHLQPVLREPLPGTTRYASPDGDVVVAYVAFLVPTHCVHDCWRRVAGLGEPLESPVLATETCNCHPDDEAGRKTPHTDREEGKKPDALTGGSGGVRRWVIAITPASHVAFSPLRVPRTAPSDAGEGEGESRRVNVYVAPATVPPRESCGARVALFHVQFS